MDGIGGQLLLVGALVLLNAAFAGSELALISLRESQVQRLEDRGRAGALVVQLTRDPNRYLSTIQIGITLAGFLASATAAVTLSRSLVEPLSFLGAAARPAAIVVVTMLLTFVTLVVGELAPKRLAMQRAEGWALLVVRPLNFLATLARPAVWILGVSTDFVVRLFGGDPSLRREEVTTEELRDMVVGHEEMHPSQRQILVEAFEASDRPIRAVMVPRTEVVGLDGDQLVSDALTAMLEAGHSRAPVYGEHSDDVLGAVHLRRLVRAASGQAVGEVVDRVMVLPESATVLTALGRMQTERQQLAIVVDEYGGVAGLVTVEDLVEEFVGEIWDESDRHIAAIERAPDGSLIVPGSFPIHDLEDIDVILPTGPYTSVAGLVIERLGRLAETGDTVDTDSWRLEVVEVAHTSVVSVRLVPLDDQAQSAATEAPDGR